MAAGSDASTGEGSAGPVVAGIDSSTQSCKVVLVDAATGRVISTADAPHPDGTEVDPAAWWDALSIAGPRAGLDGAAALSVAAQQHGMVALDEKDESVRPALLWNDVRSAAQAERLVAERTAEAWARDTGSVPVASFTVTKLAWLAEHEPGNADRVASVLLPHDWLTWRILERADEATTDRSDASGTGYFSPSENAYRTDVLVDALGHVARLPRVADPAEQVGRTDAGAVVGAGAGDNAAAALGLGLRAGEVVVSLGTSGAVFAATSAPTADASGLVAGFADATGGFLPLSCTLNAARVLVATADLLGTDLAGFDELAMNGHPDADGLVLLPYLDGERTPNLPDARGSLHGIDRGNLTPANVARASVLGMLCGMADALEALRAEGVPLERVLLIGGGSRSRAVRAAAPDLFGVPVAVPMEAEYVALGAARQAAWALSGDTAPPEWKRERAAEIEPSGAGWADDVRGGYAGARSALHG